MLKRFVKIFSTLLLVLSCGQALAASQSPVGKVLLSRGDSSAISVDASERSLRRGADVFEGDMLKTSGAGNLQVRMKDGAVVALGPDAQFEIKAYQQNENSADEEILLSLVKGGLRTITGEVEKANYRLETPVAVLGVRGTEFSVFVAEDGTTTVILHQGAIEFTGQSGSSVVLDVPGTASVVVEGGSASQPGLVPADISDYFMQFSITESESENGSVGSVVRMKGDVWVYDNLSPADRRLLAPSDIVREGDVLETGGKSLVQLQMIDGALLVVGGGSQLHLEQYRYISATNGRVIVNLNSGHLRSMTGETISQNNRTRTESAEVMPIVSRGTIFDSKIDENQVTTVILREGVISVESRCDGAATGQQQVIDVPGLATAVSNCKAPTAPFISEEISDIFAELEEFSLPEVSCTSPPCE